MDDLRHADLDARQDITDLACISVLLRNIQQAGLRYHELQLQAACICQYYEISLKFNFKVIWAQHHASQDQQLTLCRICELQSSFPMLQSHLGKTQVLETV